MADFTLDTSGAVPNAADPATVPMPWPASFYWGDLDAFTQGYVRELLSGLWIEYDDYSDQGGCSRRFMGFSDLSPEALAMILRDCAALRATVSPEDWARNTVPLRDLGANFWRNRQEHDLPNTFPPLTVALGEDGKVNLGVAK